MSSRPKKKKPPANPAQDVTQAMQAAMHAHRNGNLKEAVNQYRRVVAADPAAPQPQYNLGLALKGLGKLEGAEKAFSAAIRLSSGYARAHAALANLLDQRGKSAKALTAWADAFKANPAETDILSGLVRHLSHTRFETANARAEQLLLQLLSRADVEGQRLQIPVLSLLSARPEIKAALASRDPALIDWREPPPLLLATLTRLIIADPAWEALLTAWREEVRQTFTDLDDQRAPAVQALAAQMLATDYAYAQGAEKPQTPGAGRLSAKHIIYSLYAPLSDLPLEPDIPDEWDTFYRRHILAPSEERDAAEAIPALTPIDDATSQAVQAQYTALPYPRWLSTRAIKPATRQAVMEAAITGLPPEPALHDPAPLKILVAGCGTGKHAVDVATRFSDAEVLAIDLSRPSLGYAACQAERLGIANIRFGVGDILQLGALDARFDHIEAMGVLHHLADPLGGWAVLRSLLAPRGTMRIGLYSRRGRLAIKAAQLFAKDFSTEPEGLREFRQAIYRLPPENPAAAVARELDFYTLSGARDAFAHAQESDFDLMQIKSMLQELALAFAGFEFPTASPAELFRKRFPERQALAALDNWHLLEQESPALFHHMYQFWCLADD